MNLCVYAIAKDEAAFVDRFCASAREADSIVVLDTGSTDGTPELLRAQGCIVQQAVIDPWRFDDARNLSMALIPRDADVCLCLDLDEVLREGWRDAIEAAWMPEATRARYRYTWRFNADGSEDVVYWADKLHKRGCYRWRHPVHEVLSCSGAERVITIPGLQIDHHPDPTKSRAQYLPLLELAVREEPDDDRNVHYLGREYMYRGEWQKAIDTLQRHLALPKATWADERSASMRFIARCYRALGRDELAATWLHRAIAEAPHLREPLVDYAQLCHDQQDWRGVAYFARRALAIAERGETYITEGYAWGATPYDLLALAYYHLGDAQKALGCGARALALDAENPRLRKNLEYYRQSAEKEEKTQ